MVHDNDDDDDDDDDGGGGNVGGDPIKDYRFLYKSNTNDHGWMARHERGRTPNTITFSYSSQKLTFYTTNSPANSPPP